MGTADRRQNVLTITWTQLHQDVRKLAAALVNASSSPFKGIVAVARGGLVPAGILAKECSIRLVETVCIGSCDERVYAPEAQVFKTFSRDEGLGWLVVDDLAATGRTAALLRTMMPKAHIAVLYAKAQGIPYVHSFVAEVPQDAWLLFPWDSQLRMPSSGRR